MRPNIMLITVDQMRRDCIAAMGNPVIETPNLDMMYRQGVRFTNAYSAVPTCIAARCSLLTGQSQHRHGRVGYRDGVAWDYPHTLPSVLTGAGYQTQCVGKMHVHPARNNCGFENVVLHDGYLHYARNDVKPHSDSYEAVDDYLHWLRRNGLPSADIIDSGLECNSWVARPWPYEERYHPTNWCASETIDFFRRHDPTRPFFLHCSFVRPHSPLDPPQYYYDMYANRELPAPYMGDWIDNLDQEENGKLIDCTWGIVPTAAVQRARAAYYGLITHIDHQIGRILQSMNEHNLLQNTVVIFTSDHGDMLGDHNFFRKGLPYEGSCAIPLLVYDPGNLLGLPHGSNCNAVAELRDIMPTLLELADVPVPDTVDGKSLLPAIRHGIQPRSYLHGEHTLGDKSTQFIVTNTDKFIWFTQSGREQYFDLVSDPHECNDLISSPACRQRIEELRQLLVQNLIKRPEGYTDGVSLISGGHKYTG